jgi:hypothetical protein
MEISWGWPEITCVLMWRLAPNGVIIRRKDLGALPPERVLIENRSEKSIRFWFATIREAERIREPILEGGRPKATVSELQGRWQKLAVVLLWKLAKDGIVLTQSDRDRLPGDKTLLAHGHEQDIEYRFVHRREAQRIAQWERDNEGKMVLEAV